MVLFGLSPLPPHIPENYFKGPDGFLYKMHTTPASWNEAEKICQDEGGHLAMAKTNASRDFIGGDRWHSADFWIGVNDLKTEDQFEFADGSPVESSLKIFWASGQPDNWGSGEDCVHRLLRSNEWNDDECGRKKSFLCQKGKRADAQ